ncbi:MAG: pyridoxamine 5'-phosphate oxidase [Xanthomonadaceae bacterium]|nr:pyridoxamine 5'-phosphate oxidase [Xanthomonadaceae bacterium]
MNETGLDRPPADPFELFSQWYADARAHERHELTAMTLATADSKGRPAARIVLLKHFDQDGFIFYTNLGSRKSADFAANPQAALLFWLPVLERQIRIEGSVVRVSDSEADAYFAGRPRGSQLGAWASLQSTPLDSRATMEQRLAEFEKEYAGRDVPRPPYWGGWRLRPDHFEFWHEREARLHDRVTYALDQEGWRHARLYP